MLRALWDIYMWPLAGGSICTFDGSRKAYWISEHLEQKGWAVPGRFYGSFHKYLFGKLQSSWEQLKSNSLPALIRSIVHECYPYEISIKNLKMHYSDHTMILLTFCDWKNVTMALHLKPEQPGNGPVRRPQSVKVKMIRLRMRRLI